MNLYEDLKWRELIYDTTSEEIEKVLNEEKITFYLGADPTGDSLHVGHLVVYLLAKRLEKAGHHPIFLIGGATGSIGDPKPGSERQLLDMETLQHNAKCLHEQVKKLFNCKMVNNYDWTSNMDVLTFLRTFGKYFNVNYMINKETVKARLDIGISYTEFSYQILQALDFEHLFRFENCQMQIGGQDQWGNITGGIELIRKMDGADVKVYGLTTPLITKSDGTKFGKTAGGAVWLDAKKTSPYAFYQYWINTADADVIKRLKQFTFLSREEIENLERSVATEPHLRLAQKALAREVTVLVHGEEALKEALKITDALFSGNVFDLSADEILMGFEGFEQTKVTGAVPLIDALVLAKAAVSKREARELITNGAVSVNGNVVKDLEYVIAKENALGGRFTVLRRGKKNYYLIAHE
jgi:tyrosyl-tRNA synthetase